jgi:PST family polysaccharide transporter
MEERAVRGISWTILSYGGNRVVTVASTIVLARLLAPEDFGLFALATLGVNFVSLFSGMGLGQTLVLRHDLDRRAQGTIQTLLVLAGVLFAVVLALAAPLLARFLNEPQLDELLLALAGILSFTGVNWFYDSVLQKELEFRARFICQLARTIAYSITALVLAIAGAGVWSLIAGFAAGHVANGIALLILTPYRVPFAYDRAAAREAVREGSGFVLQDGMDFAQQNADYLIIGRVLGAQQLGFYTMSFRQAELPHYAVADPVSRVTFPSFARMRHDGEDVGSAYLTALGMVALAVLPLGVVLSGAAAPIVETFFGSQWLPMIGVLSILGLWGAIRPLEATVGWMLNAMGHASAVGRFALVLFALLVPAIILAAHGGGIETVAWVMLGQAVTALLVLTTLVSRLAGVSLAHQWRVLAPLLGAGALAWGACRGLATALDGMAPLLALALCSAGALATYLAAVRVLEPTLLRLALGRVRRAVGLSRPAPAVP